jgi:Arc/MetJ family transcription regulator
MKTTIDIPERELADAIKFTRAKTKREAVVHAVEDFNRRMRMAELTRYAGTCDDLITPEELQAARRRGG